VHRPAIASSRAEVDDLYQEFFRSQIDDMVSRAGSIAFRDGFARAGQRVIIVAGVPLRAPGTTNMLRIASVGPDGDADM